MKHISHPCAENHPAQLVPGIVAQVSPVSQVLIETFDNGHPQLRSDIHLLLHQEKLAQLGDRVASAYLDSMKTGPHPSIYPEGVTDEQIMQTIKSKYIQSPSELTSWMDHLKELAISEVNKANVQKSQDEINEQTFETNKQTSETN